MAIGYSFAGSINTDPGTLTGATGISLSSVIILSGDVPPTTMSVAGGLPPGIALNPIPVVYGNSPFDTAFEIAGTPTVPGTFDFTLNGIDSVGNTVSAPAMMTIGTTQMTEMNVPPGNKGNAYSYTFSDDFAASIISGGVPPYTYGPLAWAGPDPGGITLSSAGTLSGTPTAAELSGYTLYGYEASIPITDADMNEVSTDVAFFVFGHLAPAPEMPPILIPTPPLIFFFLPFCVHKECRDLIDPIPARVKCR